MGEKKNKRQLVINYTPGEECRVAVVNEGRLDEFHSERRETVSHVGNIYVGRVTNVEPSIQAAFIEFGLEHAGFLHTTDVHPVYFPDQDEDATERVGKKTARRDRPPIQDCLKRGQEIIVQVLKEGVGSKGPTLTSYLSIPGRYLVMMPQMDNVGVSRKVEDENARAKMKEILDSLELPEGFGFILRTAGFDRTKSELKRDLAYLMRLQKDMERRHKAGNKPRLLYSENDLLLRCLRDMLSAETDEVVIDNEIGLQRAGRFMSIFDTSSDTRLLHYKGKTPIFHAMGVEEQIRTMHAREVPLPSGGRLVIDETEALVAIDVNSGKSRSAGDSEENAYQTNLEAADEICRQIRLRDLGGIVINDLIDMRAAKHRRDIEEKFESTLSADRARSTVLPINDFGVMALTRQRMRGSHESIHFHDCPSCRGRGLIQRPESVAADALRDLAALLDHDKVFKVEVVVNPKIAAELLSTRRKQLSRIEAVFGKPLMVRLSDATPQDRVAFYAYDAQGNDIEIDRLSRFRLTNDTLAEWKLAQEEQAQLDQEFVEEPKESIPLGDDEGTAAERSLMEELPSKDDLASGDSFSLSSAVGRRGRTTKRRRGGKAGRDERPEPVRDDQAPAAPSAREPRPERATEPGSRPQEPRSESRRPQNSGGRSGIGHALGVDGRPLDSSRQTEAQPAAAEPNAAVPAGDRFEGEQGEGRGRGRRRRRRGRGRGGDGAPTGESPAQGQPAGPAQREPHPKGEARSRENDQGSDSGPNTERSEGGEQGDGGRRRRRRRGRGRGGEGRSEGREGSSDSGRAGGGRELAERSGTSSSDSPRVHVEAKPSHPVQPVSSPTSSPKPAETPKPRGLYGLFRKLKPGQAKGIKREE